MLYFWEQKNIIKKVDERMDSVRPFIFTTVISSPRGQVIGQGEGFGAIKVKSGQWRFHLSGWWWHDSVGEWSTRVLNIIIFYIYYLRSTNLELYIFLVELNLHSSISKSNQVSRGTEAQLRGIVQLSPRGNNIQRTRDINSVLSWFV